MAYLGRRGALAPVSTADIPDNSITSAKIVDGAVAVADLGNDAVGTAELANDVVISTSGAITTTGAFTSVGIDDNADANAITIDANESVGIGVTPSASYSLDVKNSLSVQGAEGVSAALYLRADEGDDDGDTWRIISNHDVNDLTLSNNTSGSYVDKITFLKTGEVGIGTATPLGGIDLRGTYTAPSSDIGNSAIFCASSEAATSSADKGGVIQFGGNYTGTTPTQWAGIVGLKDNNTDANYAGYLAFYTRAQGAAPVERMRIKSTGDIHLGTPDASFCSSEESTGSLAADATYYFQLMGCNCAYLFTYWNDDGNAYGHGISAVQTGGYSSQITTVVGYQSHYGATEAPTLAVNQSGCNWRVSLYNNDSDAKNFYGKFLSLGKD